MTPSRRLYAQQTYGRAADAFETVVWRPQTAARSNARIAGDRAVPEPTLRELMADLPGWVTVVGGGVIAALMGALVGGMLQI